MALAPGTKLGPYEILSPIGAGGMGEVYRARDPRLGRDVAIKVLPASYSEDADRLRRFEQEAKAAGALHHPNITGVFDIGQHDGGPFIVQELLEGETLRATIAGGKLSARRAVDYAVELARGLAAAHEKGIVHRDLKPENVFVTTDGQVKILDFGLAKLTEPEGLENQTNLPTATRGTEPGVVLGTLGYMSPEQVRGRPADHRSDIFSFGAILYEMLSGRRAFQGDSAADTMSAILKEDPPDLSVTNQSVAPALERIIRHCLEKSPERRAHSAHDLAFELESLTQTSGTIAASPVKRGFSLRRAVLGIAALLAVAAAYLLGRRTAAPRSEGAVPRTYRQITSFSGAEVSPSLSPDGQVVAFTRLVNRKPHVWTQRTGGQIATDLTPDCAEGSVWPAFSPDGNTIAYASRCGGGGIFVVGASGESARRLTGFGDNPAWAPDGREIVFSTESGWRSFDRAITSELWAADVATGNTRKLFAGDAVQPSVSPHRLRIAYWGLPPNGSQRDIWTIPYGGLGKGEHPVAVTQDSAIDWNPAWSVDGRFLYFISDRAGSMNLWRVRIDEATGRPLGAPESRQLPARDIGGFAISRDGAHLAYVAAEATHSIERLSIDPLTGETKTPPIEILRTTLAVDTPRSSPDGNTIAFDSMGALQEDLFLVQADGSRMRHLTDDTARDRFPGFSPDGRRIVFQSDRGGNWDIWSIGVDGSGLTQLSRRSTSIVDPILSPDGHRILATDNADMFLYELDDKGGLAPEKKLPKRPGPEFPYNGGWTPDGRAILVSCLRKDNSVAGLALFHLDQNRWESFPALPGQTAYALALPKDGVIALTSNGLEWRKLSGGPTRMIRAHAKDSEVINFGVSSDGGIVTLVRNEENADIWMATPP